MKTIVETVALDANYTVKMVTTELMEGVKLVTCGEEHEAILFINDQDITLPYTEELAAIIRDISEYTAEQLLMALVQFN